MISKMMNEPSISVIIPAYNVERWLDRAVGSMIEQTFKDIEIIIVDDGSTDDTGNIADELARSDDRVVVIHQDNCGAAQSRNNAMAISKGEYLYFMDGDDWCEPNMLEDQYGFAKMNELELVVTGFYIDTYYGDDKFYREIRNAPNIVYPSREEFREDSYKLFDAQLLYAPWNKLYLKRYLTDNSIEFPKTFWDDLPFNLDVVRDIERVGCIDGHYYHFLRARAESENTKYRPDMYSKRKEENEWLHELYSYWGLDTPGIREFLGRRYAERLIGCIENLTCKDCKLSVPEKKKAIEEMLSSDDAIEALTYARPTSKMMAQLFRPMRSGNVDLCYLQSLFISFVKRNSTNIFARLKASR